MHFTPDSIFHMIAGTIGLITGITALIARKGGPLHRRVGFIFFIAMMSTAASGAYMGLAREQPGNAVAGIVTLYLLITAWMTVLRGEKQVGWFEVGAFVFSGALAAVAISVAYNDMRSDAPFLGGIPYAIIASIVTLAALTDLRVLISRGLAGKHRIARHLWRMHLGFTAAVGSFFPGQLEIFPAYVREFKPFIALFTPPFAVLGLMLIWLAVVLFTKWYEKRAITRAPAGAAG
jgi:uncharacterized membrane protein